VMQGLLLRIIAGYIFRAIIPIIIDSLKELLETMLNLL